MKKIRQLFSPISFGVQLQVTSILCELQVKMKSLCIHSLPLDVESSLSSPAVLECL